MLSVEFSVSYFFLPGCILCNIWWTLKPLLSDLITGPLRYVLFKKNMILRGGKQFTSEDRPSRRVLGTSGDLRRPGVGAQHCSGWFLARSCSALFYDFIPVSGAGPQHRTPKTQVPIFFPRGTPTATSHTPDGPLPFRQRAGRQRPWKRSSSSGPESLQLRNANDATNAPRRSFPSQTAARRELRRAAARTGGPGPRGRCPRGPRWTRARARVTLPRPPPLGTLRVCLRGQRPHPAYRRKVCGAVNKLRSPPPPLVQGRVPLAGVSGTRG